MTNYCAQPQAHPDRCGCKPDAFQIARHSRRLVEQQRERIAALEAECERLKAKQHGGAEQSAPAGEREAAIEAAYAAVAEGGWSSVKELGLEMFRAGAAWQRAQGEQQPVGEMISNDGDIYWADRHPPMGTKLYAAPIAQAEQLEVQRLRVALEHCSDVMKDPWKHGEGCISRAIYMADAALAASTGQEVGK